MTPSSSRRLLVVAGVTLWLASLCVSALPNETGSKPGVTASESVAAPVIGGAPPASRRAPRLDERKFKYDADPKKELTQFMNTKNLVKTLVKLVFGSDEESAATSRQGQILNLLVTVLDMLKTTFGNRARSSTARGFRGALDDAALAGTTMLKGFVKSVMTKDDNCMQRYLCEASRDAVKEAHEVGYLVAQFGGYAASYALQAQKAAPMTRSYNATRSGRSGEDCFNLYSACNETD
ncbi:hypothetical protein HPB49_021904 [Dermacentor silvarum]|uniref:Uncharacterized protein n=1 Tax=Dermacentor silvarum TaxID=543639 RepID=A0ACB8C5K4_DERSI|nr:hypothetical protein HPB49_021904 [Dermacentor silvarum]